uniref:Uncharacterized protein n=1 Tax=Rhizophagus irregularis (strain DAOM 181602 / DAOM 197198 / MUCL 43194) TaxID=747089 RepID=U9TQA3_RHIID
MNGKRKYDEIGRHLVVHEETGEEFRVYDSLFLMDCKGYKEVIVNVGAVVQKEVEVLEKRKKAYAVALMVVIMILPYNVKIDLRTDLDVIEWLYEYNEYSLRWNYIPIEEAYRFWFKELTYNTISANGSNVLIDWSVSFKLINNEVTTPRNVNIVKMPRLDVLGIWICDKNDASDAEFVIFKDSIDEVLTNYTKEFDADKVNNCDPENLLREVMRV